ncbi:GtrA family protein [Dyella sp. 20L07]|uniref:GtrA family protein n=1 Tax=Dyella sp. 20L07 TaxID=3384240 RepID=UPI003D26FCD1
MKYGLIGVANTLLTLSVIFALIYWLVAPALVANAIGCALGFCCSYLLNRFWTFRSQAPVGQSAGRYLVAALVAYGLNAVVIHRGITWFDASEYWIQLVGTVVYAGSLFLFSRMWVFRRHRESRIVQ